MHVLLLTQWYPPEPQKIVSDIAIELIRAGHRVTVLTGFPNFPDGRLYDGYRIRLVMREEMDGVPVVRVPLFPDHSRSTLKRAFNLISFAWSAALIGPCVVDRPDIVYVIQPITSMLPALVLSRLGRIPVVYEVQDMWPETLAATGFVRNRIALAGVGILMKAVYRFVEGVRVISAGFMDNLKAKGVNPEKVWMIPNWVDTDWYRPMSPDTEAAISHGLSGKFNVMFAGTMGYAQDLGTVLNAAERLLDMPDIQFVLVGGGSLRDGLKEDANRRGLINVRFLDAVPQEEVTRIQSLADVLLVHLRDEPLFRITVPHKTLGYLACGKPVLIGVAGDASDVVSSSRAGLACQPGDPASMAEAILSFYGMTAEERQAMGDRGREFVCRHYSRQQLVGRIAEMLVATVSRRTTGCAACKVSVCPVQSSHEGEARG